MSTNGPHRSSTIEEVNESEEEYTTDMEMNYRYTEVDNMHNNQYHSTQPCTRPVTPQVQQVQNMYNTPQQQQFVNLNHESKYKQSGLARANHVPNQQKLYSKFDAEEQQNYQDYVASCERKRYATTPDSANVKTAQQRIDNSVRRIPPQPNSSIGTSGGNDIIGELTDRFMAAHYVPERKILAESVSTLPPRTCQRSSYAPMEQLYTKEQPCANGNRNYASARDANRKINATNDMAAPLIREKVPPCYSEIRKPMTTKDVPITGDKISENSKALDSDTIKKPQSNRTITVNCVFDEKGKGEPHFQASTIDATLELEKSKKLIIKLIDSEMEKLKIKATPNRHDVITANATVAEVGGGEKYSNPQVKNLKIACIQKIDEELSRLKLLESLSELNSDN